MPQYLESSATIIDFCICAPRQQAAEAALGIDCFVRPFRDHINCPRSIAGGANSEQRILQLDIGHGKLMSAGIDTDAEIASAQTLLCTFLRPSARSGAESGYG
jgi:hypothetical protein